MTAGGPAIADWLPPALLQAADDPPGTPRLLEALLGAVDSQRLLLAADIDQVWDDLFIESCSDWAVPYIGALVGLPADAGRLEVAYAIALRRRKGTPRALEDFARAITGWTARAQEGWQLAISAQRLDHSVTPASVDLRGHSRFPQESPFHPLRRSVTPGAIVSPRAAGVLVWPWHVRTLRAAQAVPLGNRRYALHPFKLQAPLYVRPPVRPLAADDGNPPPADERGAPVRATYRVLEALAGDGQITYGTAWTLADEHPLASEAGAPSPPLISLTVGGKPVDWSALRFASITSATPDPGGLEVLVDVARGQLVVGKDLGTGVRATWNRPVSGAVGALAADSRADMSAQVIVSVRDAPETNTSKKKIEDAIAAAEKLSQGKTPTADESGVDVEIRLETSDSLDAPSAQKFKPSLPRWRIVAPALMTPAIRGTLELDLEDCCLSLEGFLLDGDLTLGPSLAGVRLEALTMNVAAGRTLGVAPTAWTLSLEARRCILGPIRSDLTAGPIRLEDCIVDGLGARMSVCEAAAAPGAPKPAVAAQKRFAPTLSASGCTFAGLVDVEAVDADNCIFVDGVNALRQQEGCLRHSYIGPDITPPLSHPTSYRCLTAPAPRFASTAFESGGYYALDLGCQQPLLSAASDGGEAGAYHHARRGPALSRLRGRLHEFVPLGLRAQVALADWEE